MGRSTGTKSNRDREIEMRRGQAWWGIAGMILVAAFVAIAAVLSGPVGESTVRLVPGIDQATWRIFVGGGIFVLMLAISGIIFSIFAPRKKDKFSERELDKERKGIQYEALMKKQRAKATRARIAKARREGK